MVTGQLWQDVMGLVYAIVSSLSSQSGLPDSHRPALAPAPACCLAGRGRQAEYLQEMMPVSYIPSARSLAHVRRIASAADERAAGCGRAPTDQALPSSKLSCRGDCHKIPLPESADPGARKSNPQCCPPSAAGAEVAHFSCHGGANWSDPEKSGLLMANDEILTVKDLFELHLEGARLATLSACETGVPGTKLPDEVVSLPSAFIRAGFAGAIGSLWTVEDKSTAQLMTSFYQLWRKKGMTPVQALAEAQKKLRKRRSSSIHSTGLPST